MKKILFVVMMLSSFLAFSSENTLVSLVKNKAEFGLKTGNQDVVKLLKLSSKQLSSPYLLLLEGVAVSPGKRGMLVGNNIMISIEVNGQIKRYIKIAKSNAPGLMKFKKYLDLSEFKSLKTLVIKMPGNKATLNYLTYGFQK